MKLRISVGSEPIRVFGHCRINDLTLRCVNLFNLVTFVYLDIVSDEPHHILHRVRVADCELAVSRFVFHMG